MFDEKDLRPTHCVTTVEKLLWNMNENLKEIRKALGKPTGAKKCKQCEFTCDDQAELMRHYQQAHPKEKPEG